MAEPVYPADADGDALRRIQADGSDMSKPMDIDFAVAVPSEEAGNQVAHQVTSRGYRASVERDSSGGWTCYCTRSMVPAYDALMAAQRELDEISAPVEGYSDGWGSFGNGPQ